jgi:hypothetical protein
MTRVFICYSRDDKDFVSRLVADLRLAGVPTWRDVDDIPSDEDASTVGWRRAIDHALDECTHMIVVLSPTSVESEEVEREASYFLSTDRPIFPVLYRDCRIPYWLHGLERFDLLDNYRSEFERLVHLLGTARATAETGAVKAKQSRKPPMWGIAAGVVGALIVIALIGLMLLGPAIGIGGEEATATRTISPTFPPATTIAATTAAPTDTPTATLTEMPSATPTDTPTEPPEPITIILPQAANLTRDLSPGQGCSFYFRAGIAPIGNPIRGFTNFDITALHGATIESATLDVSDYELSGGSAFEFLHPLHIEQVDDSVSMCGEEAFYARPIVSLAQYSDFPGLNTPIDVTEALADYLETGDPDYFRIRVRWEHDDAGAAFANMITWGAVELRVTYVP